MKITTIDSFCLRFEYQEGFTYAGGRCTGRLTNLVRVHTDEGLMGIGSTYSHPSIVHLVIKQQLEPLLIGKDPTQVEELWDEMYGLTRWYGRKGAAMSALGALDMAFWDLRGQAADQPIWKLLGGEQNTCPAYGSALLWKEPSDLAKEASALVTRGFLRVKMRLARDPDWDRAAVQAVRDAVGQEVDIMVDGSMRYNADTAFSTARMLEEHNCFWFEEPFAPENLTDFVKLRQNIGIPLAAGENEFGEQGFRELITTGAVDIIQPDACRCGGITEVLRSAVLAKEADLKMATHSWSDAIAITANAHIVSAMSNGLTVEIDQTGNPFVESLLTDPLVIKNGQLSLTNKPGLGIQLDEDFVSNNTLTDPFNIPDGAYSDMAFGTQHWNPAPPFPSL